MFRTCRTLLFALSADAIRSNLKVERAKAVGKVMENIGSLLKQGNADEEVMSHLRALAGHSETPDYDTTMEGIVNKVVESIEQDVEEKIRVAHKQAQAAVDATMAAVRASTTEAVTQKGIADGNDNTWYDCIAEEKHQRKLVEESEAAVAQAEADQIQPCNDQAAAKTYTFAPINIAPFSCNIEAQECDAALATFESQDASRVLHDLQVDYFTKNTVFYNSKAVCDAAKMAVSTAQLAMYNQQSKWSVQKATCVTHHETRKLAMCEFGRDLQNKCEKVSDHQAQLTLVNGVGNQFSHADRMAEWKTTAHTKCMLRNIVAGVTLDAAASLACDANVNYNDDVGLLNTYDSEYATLTTGTQFTCSETTIGFKGDQWTWPLVDEPTSEQYTVEAYTPAVTLTAGIDAFEFCGATPTCEGSGGGAPCVFPFNFIGVNHVSCTTVGHLSGRPWCATATVAGAYTGAFGYCDCGIDAGPPKIGK